MADNNTSQSMRLERHRSMHFEGRRPEGRVLRTDNEHLEGSSDIEGRPDSEVWGKSRCERRDEWWHFG